MGRRASRHAFLPNFYVFPGGRLDRADFKAPALSDIDEAVASDVANSCADPHGYRHARALAVAAARETHEETGLVLGDVDADGLYRPDLARLGYVGRAITPPESPIRFHARFFTCSADMMHGSVRSNGELLDLDWRPVREALALPIADVTEFMLEELMRLRRQSAIRTGIPLFSYRNAKPNIRYE